MVAFGILAVAILGLIGVFSSGVSLAAQARDLSVATELGRQVMERIRSATKNADFSHIPVSYTHLTLPTTPYV